MDIWESDKLVLFIGFVIPGFVSLKTYELLFLSTPKDSSNQLTDAVAYSCINYALLFWPIYEVETQQLRVFCPRAYILFYALVLLFAPVIWVLLFRKLRLSKFVQRTLPHPTEKPWDYVFQQRKQFWIIVTLKDGNKIGGKYSTVTAQFSALFPTRGNHDKLSQH
jgi:hypothetical protein